MVFFSDFVVYFVRVTPDLLPTVRIDEAKALPRHQTLPARVLTSVGLICASLMRPIKINHFCMALKQ
jgi:hypothetical protein